MRKISIKNLFKKSESDTGKKNKAKMLILLLILIVTAGVIYWWYPLVFPDSAVKSPVASVTVTTPAPTTVMPEAEVESAVKEETEFEIEMKEREQGYKYKVFVYEPYKPPSNRNPFQKVRTSTPAEEVEEVKEVKVLKFPKPELPPGTKLSGIIGSKDKKVAIIEMNGEIYIAILYDIISERYIVKEIKKDEVIIDFNGYFFSLKIGGKDF
ncbi:hypothetical protein KJ830_07215 [bacterium]|nr:hypothetical protein [bacterium]